MNAISKKLLSLLVVVAMVCVMVPAVSVPAAAAENPGADAIAAAKAIQDEVVTELDSKAEQFATGGQVAAKCPVCGSTKYWNPASGSTAITAGHYYIPAGYNGTVDIIQGTANGRGCLYLNGQTVNTTGRIATLNAAGDVNVMGSGTVVSSNSGGTVAGYNGGTINLYGGTYLNSNADAATIYPYHGNIVINIYDGVTIGRPATVTSANKPVVLLSRGVVNMYGGEITGGNNTGNGGNVQILKNSADHKAIFNMYDGEITGGSAPYGGNVYVAIESGATGATFNMFDGVVSGGSGSDGGKFDNIYVVNANMTMSGDSVVYGTKNGAAGCGIRLAGNSNLTLSGNASVLPGEGSGNVMQLGGTNPIVLDNWSGTAYAGFSGASYGSELACTIQGTYAGTITCESTGTGTVYEGGKLYAGAASIVSKDGDATKTVWYKSSADALAAYNSQSYLRLYTNTALNNGTYYVDIAKAGIEITGNGNLYLMDSSNDDFDGNRAATVTGPTVNTVATNPVNGNKYIALQGEDGYTAHRAVVKLTNVTLRAGAAGLYYKAAYMCDDILAEKISAYGVAVSLDDMPDANFLSDAKTMFSAIDGFDPDENHTVAGNSCSVFGILKDGEENAKRAAMDIYANPYIMIDIDGDGNYENDVAVVGYTDDVAYSLNDVVDAVRDMDNLTEGQQKSFNDFLAKWPDVFGNNA